MNECKCDKSVKCCATCSFWGGDRTFDGLGTYTYDLDRLNGPCNQMAWKGFSGAQVPANFICPDYNAQHK